MFYPRYDFYFPNEIMFSVYYPNKPCYTPAHYINGCANISTYLEPPKYGVKMVRWVSEHKTTAVHQ